MTGKTTVTCIIYFYLNICIHKGSTIGYDGFGSREEDFFVNSSVVDWNKAHYICSSANGSLVEVKDLQKQNTNNTELLKKYNSSFWSSVTGSFTPWIVYRGCFAFGNLRRKSLHNIRNQNTVGNCFNRCKMHNRNCNINNAQYFNFGLMGNRCYCLCHDVESPLAESRKCDTACKNSPENGFCGGSNHVSLYKVDTRNVVVSGFCLAYNCLYNETLGHDCTEEYEGYCVEKIGQHYNFTIQHDLTWNDYSRACKQLNIFMTAYHKDWPRQPSCNGHAWTGIRKYRITRQQGLRSCYTLQWELKWEYVKSNCEERHRFICKFEDSDQSLGRKSTEIPKLTTEVKITKITNISSTFDFGTRPRISFPWTSELFSTRDHAFFAKHRGKDFQKTSTTVNISSTTWDKLHMIDNIDSKSTDTIGIIVGSILAFSLCMSIPLLLLYIKRRKVPTPSIKFSNNAYDERGNYIGDTNDLKENAIYINYTPNAWTETTAKSDHDDVYVENAEGEYDILHSSRQKKSPNDNPQYDSTIGWENVYSSTTHQDNINHGNSDESDYNTMDGTWDRNSSMENSDYDTCNRYVTSDGNLYQKV